jgi:hypothetical protein
MIEDREWRMEDGGRFPVSIPDFLSSFNIRSSIFNFQSRSYV